MPAFSLGSGVSYTAYLKPPRFLSKENLQEKPTSKKPPKTPSQLPSTPFYLVGRSLCVPSIGTSRWCCNTPSIRFPGKGKPGIDPLGAASGYFQPLREIPPYPHGSPGQLRTQPVQLHSLPRAGECPHGQFQIPEEVSGGDGSLGLRGDVRAGLWRRRGSHEVPALCPHGEGFSGLPSGRAAMFDSLPVAFVGAGSVPAACNGGAWGVRKGQFFHQSFFLKNNLHLPRNNGEFLPALLPAQQESWGACPLRVLRATQLMPPPPASSLCGENSEENPPQKRTGERHGQFGLRFRNTSRTMSKPGIPIPGNSQSSGALQNIAG